MSNSIKISYNNNPELPDTEFVTSVKQVPRIDEKVYHKGSLYKVVEVVHDIYFQQIRISTEWSQKIK